MNITKSIDVYLSDGCGRCSKGGTPDCNIHTWIELVESLREILLETGLEETMKWGSPVYTEKGKNIALISVLNEYACLSFFKGVLLEDKENYLITLSENSNSYKLFKFTSVKQILELRQTIQAYIFEAIEIENSGIKLPKHQITEDQFPDELMLKFNEIPELKTAFEGLTPGRQRAYLLYFNGAKQSKTRTARIERYLPKIMDNKGFHD